MADLYIASTGSNTAPYDTWAKAATTPLTAVNAAAAGDNIFQHAEVFAISAHTTYAHAGTDANPVRWICTNDKVNEPPQITATTGKITAVASIGVTIKIRGGVFVYGLEFETSGPGGSGSIQNLGLDRDVQIFEKCSFRISNDSGNSFIEFGIVAASHNSRVETINCSFIFGGHTSQRISSYSHWHSIGDTFTRTGASDPNTLIGRVGVGDGPTIEGADISALTSDLVTGTSTTATVIRFNSCKINAASNILGTNFSAADTEVYLNDTSVGDVHSTFEHHTYLGNTTVSEVIFANDTDAAKFDGTNGFSIKITGTNATKATPYKSPWIKRYNDSFSSITPNMEIVRIDSSVAFQDDEVWGEWLTKSNSGFSTTSITTDRMSLLGVPTNQDTGALGAASWIGEGTGNWYGKLQSPTVTPAEIGMLSARIGVSSAITIYVDPTIRGV